MTAPDPLGTSSDSAPGEPEFSTAQMLKVLITAFDTQNRAMAAFTQCQATVTQAQPLAPASPPTVPAFISTPVSSDKSLFDTFPTVEASILLEVTRHELKPINLGKLDSKHRDKADDEGNRTSSTKDYPSLSSIIKPLQLYFRILIFFASTGGQVDTISSLSMGIVQYIGHLHALNRHYEWSAVLRYHMHYHALRRREMMNSNYAGWGPRDSDLVGDFLQGYELRSAHKRSTESSSSLEPRTGQTKRVPIEQQSCFAWNKGNCTNSSCQRIHQCSVPNCHSKDHMERACPKKKRD